jgi:uncharacterized OB-fold protein
MRSFSAAAREGKLALQHCLACGRVQYPPREMCGTCLHPEPRWRVSEKEDGVLLAATTLYHSNEPRFRPLLPLRIGSVQLDLGPVVIGFLRGSVVPGDRVRVQAEANEVGQATLAVGSA